METGVDTLGFLTLLSQQERRGATRGRVFVCKTCGRRFPTFQALGGHRASHRRPTRPYAVPGLRRTTTHGEGECAAAPARVHGCPVCGIEFAVGQALGGHMRRHRTAAAAGAHGSGDDATSVKAEDVGTDSDRADGICFCLDLSLAPSVNCAKCRMNAVTGDTTVVQGVQKTLILDCHL